MTSSTTETPNPLSDAAPLDDDTRHGILSSRRRRVLLDVLDGRQTPVDVAALAEAVEAREHDAGAESKGVQQVAVTLHHNHLPRLAQAGVVEYDSTARRVESARADLTR